MAMFGRLRVPDELLAREYALDLLDRYFRHPRLPRRGNINRNSPRGRCLLIPPGTQNAQIRPACLTIRARRIAVHNGGSGT